MNIAGKSIIVTGAGNGIGEGIARHLAAQGARVVVNDIDAERGERVAQAIRAEGGTAAFFKTDVTRRAEVQQLVDEALLLYGRLDAVVNNAGWTHRNKPLLESTRTNSTGSMRSTSRAST